MSRGAEDESFRATLRALLARDAGAGEPDGLLYERPLQPATKLELVMLSMRERDGEPLTDGQRALLRAWRARTELLAAVQQAVEAAVPGTACVKGRALAALYPPGIVRTQNDVDLVVPDPGGVWRAVAVARRHGFDLVALTVLVIGRALHVAAGLERIDGSEARLPGAGVEVGTLDFTGMGLAVPARPHVPEAARHWVRQGLALLEERLQRRFRLRDDLDFALLARAAAPPDAAALGRAAAASGVARPLREMSRRLAAAGLATPELSAAARAAGPAARERARRLAAVARHAGQPQVLLASGAQALARRGRELPLPAAVTDRLLGATDKFALLRAGLGLYGLQVGSREGDFALSRRGRQVLATTPVGTFLLVPAGAVPPGWLEEAGVAVAP